MTTKTILKNCIIDFFRDNCTEEFDPDFAKYCYGNHLELDTVTNFVDVDTIPNFKYICIIQYDFQHPFVKFQQKFFSQKLDEKIDMPFLSFVIFDQVKNYMSNLTIIIDDDIAENSTVPKYQYDIEPGNDRISVVDLSNYHRQLTLNVDTLINYPGANFHIVQNIFKRQNNIESS